MVLLIRKGVDVYCLSKMIFLEAYGKLIIKTPSWLRPT